MIVAAIDTGCRQGELRRLRWSDVDLQANTLRVTSYKGKTVPSTASGRSREDTTRNVRALGCRISGEFGIFGCAPRRSKSSNLCGLFAMHFNESLHIPQTYFIEVKRWKERVGIEVIQQVWGAMMLEKQRFVWHVAIIVRAATRICKSGPGRKLKLMGVYLKDRGDLLRWLTGYKQLTHPRKTGPETC
jgi:Restriction endonuclease